MPKILVVSNPSTEVESSMTLEEIVEPENLSSDHYAAQLIERGEWAVSDAKDAEHQDE